MGGGCVYSFPKDAEAEYPTLESVKQQKFVLLYSGGQKFDIKVPMGLCSL